MSLTKELEALFSELTTNPYLHLSPCKGEQSGNVQADSSWLEGNRLVFRSDLKGNLDSSTVDLFIKNTKSLLDKYLGHSNWIEDIGENPKGTPEAWSKQNGTRTQIGLTVTVGENCRVAAEQIDN